jgi:uncharacterized protein YbcI
MGGPCGARHGEAYPLRGVEHSLCRISGASQAANISDIRSAVVRVPSGRRIACSGSTFTGRRYRGAAIDPVKALGASHSKTMVRDPFGRASGRDSGGTPVSSEHVAAETHHDYTIANAAELPRLSSAMVKLYKEQFGRGPLSARSYYAGPDSVICYLTKSLTPVEQNMRDYGEGQRLREMRMLFQHLTEPQFRAAAEEVLGRRVIAFMSGIDIENDISCEAFVLEPRQ